MVCHKHTQTISSANRLLVTFEMFAMHHDHTRARMYLGMRGASVSAGLFERAMAMEKRSEKCYFIYAQYLDQLMRDAKQRQEAAAPKSAGAGRANPQDRLSGRSR